MIAFREAQERKAGPAGYHLRIELDGIAPAIWRELAVPSDFTLLDLHDVIQIAMGWEGEHLHQFEVGKRIFGDPETAGDLEVEDEDVVTLDQLITRKGNRFRYVYDFGDDWSHTIRILEVLKDGSTLPQLIVLAGERAAPPEDCGGIPGYYALLYALEHPSEQESADWLEWHGDYNPDEVDMETINAELHAFFYGDD